MSHEHASTFPAGYLPFDCPACGRRRLEYGTNGKDGVVYVECEKCHANSDDETLNLKRAESRKEQGDG